MAGSSGMLRCKAGLRVMAFFQIVKRKRRVYFAVFVAIQDAGFFVYRSTTDWSSCSNLQRRLNAPTTSSFLQALADGEAQARDALHPFVAGRNNRRWFGLWPMRSTRPAR